MKKKVKMMGLKIKKNVRNVYWQCRQSVQNNSGMSVVELLLILVVIIALVLIFKNQLTELVNTIFEKITSESSGI